MIRKNNPYKMKKNVTDAVHVPNACHEGAIQMVDGKARLMRDDFLRWPW